MTDAPATPTIRYFNGYRIEEFAPEPQVTCEDCDKPAQFEIGAILTCPSCLQDRLNEIRAASKRRTVPKGHG